MFGATAAPSIRDLTAETQSSEVRGRSQPEVSRSQLDRLLEQTFEPFPAALQAKSSSSSSFFPPWGQDSSGAERLELQRRARHLASRREAAGKLLEALEQEVLGIEAELADKLAKSNNLVEQQRTSPFCVPCATVCPCEDGADVIETIGSQSTAPTLQPNAVELRSTLRARLQASQVEVAQKSVEIEHLRKDLALAGDSTRERTGSSWLPDEPRLDLPKVGGAGIGLPPTRLANGACALLARETRLGDLGVLFGAWRIAALRQKLGSGGVEDSDLPPGWKAATDPSTGRPYYYNSSTREVQWEPPVAQGAAAPNDWGAGVGGGFDFGHGEQDLQPQPQQQSHESQEDEMEHMQRLQEQLDTEEEEQQREQEEARKRQEQARQEQAWQDKGPPAHVKELQKMDFEPGSAVTEPTPSNKPSKVPPLTTIPSQSSASPTSSPKGSPRMLVATPTAGGPAIGSEFIVTLKKEPGAKALGLDIGHWKKPSAVLVAGVKLGLVEKWNANNPTLQIDKGDIITSANGKSGYKDALKEISQVDNLQLVVVKGGGTSSPRADS